MEHIGTYLQFIVIVYPESLVVKTVIGYLSLRAVEVEISFTYKERAFGVLRHTGNRDHAQADVPTGNESCIGLVSQVVRAKIIIPHITQQTADAGTFTIKISNIELFTRTDQGAPAAKVDNLHRRTIESPIIYGINEIRVTHIDRVLQFSFQTVLRINESLITYRAIEVPIIVQDIRRYFLPDVRINGRYEYGSGGKAIEYPLTKTFFVLRKTIIHPQSEWKRDAVFGATEQGVIGSFGKGGFHFFHSSLAYLGIRAVLYNHRLLTGVEHFAFGQVLSSGAGCQKQGCKEDVYEFLHFDSLNCAIVISFTLFAHRFYFLLSLEYEQLTQAVHLTAKHKADTCLGYLTIEHTFIVFVVEHADIACTAIVQTIFQRNIIDE